MQKSNLDYVYRVIMSYTKALKPVWQEPHSQSTMFVFSHIMFKQPKKPYFVLSYIFSVCEFLALTSLKC